MPYDKFIICHQNVAIAKKSNYENNPHTLKMCAEIFERMMHKLLVMKTGLQSEKIGINRWSDNIIPPPVPFPFFGKFYKIYCMSCYRRNGLKLESKHSDAARLGFSITRELRRLRKYRISSP
jgi:hypothetical protein